MAAAWVITLMLLSTGGEAFRLTLCCFSLELNNLTTARCQFLQELIHPALKLLWLCLQLRSQCLYSSTALAQIQLGSAPGQRLDTANASSNRGQRRSAKTRIAANAEEKATATWPLGKTLP